MSISRRRFLQRASAMGLTAAIPLSVGNLAYGQHANNEQKNIPQRTPLTDGEVDPLEYMTEAMFAEQVGTRFRVQQGAFTRVELELVRVKTHETTPVKGMPEYSAKEGFTIRFLGPRDVRLEQDSYLFEHDVLGSFALFIVPTNSNKKGRYYEAVFTRLVR